MAVKKVVTHPAEVLETPAETVTVFDKKLKKLLDDMYDTMLEMDGVGLAAPQIGILKRAAVVDIGDDRGRIDLVNPEILEKSGEQTGIEGCLSFMASMVMSHVPIMSKCVRLTVRENRSFWKRVAF